MIWRYLQVVLFGNAAAMPKPSIDDLIRELLLKLSATSCSQIDEQLRPRLQASLLDDPSQLSPKIFACPPKISDGQPGAFRPSIVSRE
jgi:hypothetical protein